MIYWARERVLVTSLFTKPFRAQPLSKRQEDFNRCTKKREVTQ